MITRGKIVTVILAVILAASLALLAYIVNDVLVQAAQCGGTLLHNCPPGGQ